MKLINHLLSSFSLPSNSSDSTFCEVVSSFRCAQLNPKLIMLPYVILSFHCAQLNPLITNFVKLSLRLPLPSRASRVACASSCRDERAHETGEQMRCARMQCKCAMPHAKRDEGKQPRLAPP